MKTIRVNTVVENDACDESREYTFKTGRPLSATAYLDPKKTSNVWANHYATDDTWTISIGNVTVHDIGQKDMLNLIKVIQEETEKIDVTSNDNT